MILETIIDIDNPNSFELSVKNFELESNTKDGNQIGKIKLKGGDVPGNSKKTFSSEDNFVLKNENLTVLKNKIKGQIAVKFYGLIQKTIPFEIDITTSLEEVFNQISQPDIKIVTELIEIYEKGLNFSTRIDIYNPTNFLFNMEKVTIKFEKEDGTHVGRIDIVGDPIKPKETACLFSNGTLFFDAFDAKVLWMNLTGIAGAKIAGIYKNVKISAGTSVIIPDVKEFVFGGEEIVFQIPVQFKFRLNGIKSNVGFKMYNPSNVTLLGENLLCSIYRLDGERQTLLGEQTMKVCTLSPRQYICVRTNITIPYIKYLIAGRGRILPDWIILQIRGDFFIAGTRQAVPLSLNAYVDPDIIFEKKSI